MPTSWAPPFLSVQLDTTKKQGEISSSKTPSQTKVEHKYYTLASIKERQKLYLRNSLHERETSWIRVLKGLKKRCLSSLNFFWCCWILYIHTHTDNLLKFKIFFFSGKDCIFTWFSKMKTWASCLHHICWSASNNFWKDCQYQCPIQEHIFWQLPLWALGK